MLLVTRLQADKCIRTDACDVISQQILEMERPKSIAVLDDAAVDQHLTLQHMKQSPNISFQYSNVALGIAVLLQRKAGRETSVRRHLRSLLY